MAVRYGNAARVHAVKIDQDFPNFFATALCEDIEPGKSAFAATKADRAGYI